MPALTCASIWPWSPFPWNASPQRGRPIQGAQGLADRQHPHALTILQAQAQAQAQAQDRAKTSALWEVMMRPA